MVSGDLSRFKTALSPRKSSRKDRPKRNDRMRAVHKFGIGCTIDRSENKSHMKVQQNSLFHERKPQYMKAWAGLNGVASVSRSAQHALLAIWQGVSVSWHLFPPSTVSSCDRPSSVCLGCCPVLPTYTSITLLRVSYSLVSFLRPTCSTSDGMNHLCHCSSF
jgi:hypothetical protein